MRKPDPACRSNDSVDSYTCCAHGFLDVSSICMPNITTLQDCIQCHSSSSPSDGRDLVRAPSRSSCPPTRSSCPPSCTSSSTPSLVPRSPESSQCSCPLYPTSSSWYSSPSAL